MRYCRTILLLTIGLWAGGITSNSWATNKILVLTSQATNAEVVKAIHKGLLDSFEQTYQEDNIVYSLDNNYQIEWVSYAKGENPLETYSHDKEVITIICQTSSDCEPAVKNSADKNVLVIALTATNTLLGNGENILRLAPSNALQAKAIYEQLKKDEVKRFVVVYEPAVYAMDLYSSILGEYFIDVVEGVAKKPVFVSAFPVSDFLNLSATQKGTTATKILQILPQLNLDALVFLGFNDSFKALTDVSKGGDATLVKNWYAGDAIFPLTQGFAGLRVFSLYMPDDGTSSYPQYYYARDAGIFLKTVMTSYEATVGGTPSRDKFLEIAKQTHIPIEFSKTGAKSFSEADGFGRFNLHSYDAADAPAVTQEIAVSAY